MGWDVFFIYSPGTRARLERMDGRFLKATRTLFTGWILFSLLVFVPLVSGCRDSNDGLTETLIELYVTDYLEKERSFISACKVSDSMCINYYTQYTEAEAKSLCGQVGTLYSRDQDTCETYVTPGSASPCDYFEGGYPSGDCPHSGSASYCKYSGLKKTDVVYYSFASYSAATLQADCEANGGTWVTGYP